MILNILGNGLKIVKAFGKKLLTKIEVSYLQLISKV